MNRRTLLSLLAAGGVSLAGLELPGVAAQDDPMRGDDPMAAAERLSELEIMEYLPPLYEFYGYMHEDAKAIIPQSTVIGWYQEEFHPREPQKAVATGVTMLDTWTWDVTGRMYENVAEVSYTQEFADGTVEDVVRLVFHDHTWRWFFGRDKQFVDEQNLRFSQMDHLEPSGVAPFGFDSLTTLDESVLSLLPATIYDDQFETEYELTESAGSYTSPGIRKPTHLLRYAAVNPPSEFDLGTIYFGGFSNFDSDDAAALSIITESVQSTPPTELLAWNPEPETGPAYVYTTTPGVDVVGQSWRLIVVRDLQYLEISMFSEASLEKIGQSIAANGA